ncbi:TonB-dependent receptor [Flavobacterium terrae]|uniref:Outer membrane receptor proteins, mostly Fe transport n=1 Tax=Flavobacterium terrae TaxID=415425 RepID=A0A1M6CWV8_9FLAO|nr:TonB-dependent receptor plug domain-containing protein [Flavobacterium terrae]SHI65449.1 Outer membrane receptor proteins, mostly Fe transport [Flavobacterium terrae]
MKNILAILFFLQATLIYSQIQKGAVLDSLNNPIENAYILNLRTKAHAHTDDFGKFSIENTTIKDTLTVSALGFEKQTFPIETNDIKIILIPSIFKLDEVVVNSKLSAMNIISKIDLAVTPVKSSQEILRKVPGLFIGQHAGGGKAEQIFLRGFDIDHGTDIALDVDGIPVNMVSHAHGQGYADLHFVIPETIDKIDFGKGSYYASKGDFSTAGYVSFKTKERIDNSSVGAEVGQFNTLRIHGIFDLLEPKSKNSAYIASEYMLTDGPFESPQNFKRINILGKYTYNLLNNGKVSFLASHFTSNWDASGQIPQRLVDNGTISRFGAVDNTEGGETQRTNFNVSFVKPIDENLSLKTNVYFSNYQFKLYSNFTFFLNDPVNGDQIRQKEFRNIYGLNSEFNQKMRLGNLQLGLGFRNDETSNSELSHTLNRNEVLENIKLGDINQTNLFSYLNAEINFGKLKVNPSIRLDHFKFNYQDKLQEKYTNESVDKTIVSPKLNFIYTHNNNLQLFLKSGYGFHSNDARVVVSQLGKEILPSSFGSDLGILFKPLPKLIVNSSVWLLKLQQEFVYVGDEGVVEPSGKTMRKGIDLGIRYQFNNYLFFDSDLTYTHARSTEEPEGLNYIPLAPDFTTTAGISLKDYKNWSGGIQYRYLKSRPANEDNSIVALGYGITDANINYEWKNFTFGLSAENILNVKWNETQFATESQLQNESQSVTEIHFTPGTPFNLKGKVLFKF